MSDTYLTTFKGDIDLSSVLPMDQKVVYELLDRVMTTRIGNIATVNKDTESSNFSGTMDDSDEVIEKLLNHLSGFLHTLFPQTIQAFGDDPGDRWDIVLMSDGVYIQDYELVKGDIRLYEKED